MRIEIPVFSGMRPLVDPRLLEPNQAQVADNCDLAGGTLRPLARLLVETRLGVLGVEDILRYNGAWLPFYEPVSLCRSLVNADELDRMYYTGRGSGAMMFREAAGVGAEAPVRLGVPAPAAAPGVALVGTGTGDVTSTYYLYTIVSDLGEESAPSPASAILDVIWGSQSVQLSALATPDMAGRNPATKKRIYRGVSGTTETRELFVAEIDAEETTYLDAALPSTLAEALPTEGWLPPPDGLQGLTAVRGGSLAGFVGHRVYFCEPFAPYAWPRKYAQSLEHSVAALAATGSHLVALTDASAYLIPCDDVTATAPTRLEGYTPCVGPRGVVSMRQGVLFPGVDGLYLVGGGSTTPQNLTAGVISAEDWQGLNPASFRAWGLGDRYICFCQDASGQRRGFVFDLARPDMLLGLNMHATCGWLEPEGRRLHLGLENGGRTTIALWEGDGTVRETAQWRSKVFRFPAPVHMAAARVEADFPRLMTEAEYEAVRAALSEGYADEIASGELGGMPGTAMCGDVLFGGDILDMVLTEYTEQPVLTFQLFADGREVYRRNVTGPAPFPLPMASGSEWEVCISGGVTVRNVAVATSMAELRAG